MIEIREADIEALIQQRLHSGSFESVAAVLRQALTDAPLPSHAVTHGGSESGAALVEALRRSPFCGLGLDFEGNRFPMPVRKVEL